MSKAALNAKLNILQNIPSDELKEPSNMPVAVYLREAEKLVKVGRRDLVELKNIGFSEGLLDDLAVRIGALRRAESEQKMLRHGKSGARHAWDELSAKGYRLRDNLLAALCFACRKDKTLVTTLRTAGRGRASHAMIQSLSNLAVLGRENRASLQAINFELRQLDEAATLAKRLGVLLGRVDHEKERAGEARLLRDAAFTHLQAGLKELREFGLYLFGEDREKMLDYTSDYLRMKRQKRKRLVGKRVVAPAVGRKKVELTGIKGDVWHRSFPEERGDGTAKTFARTKEGERAAATGRRASRKPGESEKNGRMQLVNSTTALVTCMNELEVRTEASGKCTESPGRRTETSGSGLNKKKIGCLAPGWGFNRVLL